MLNPVPNNYIKIVIPQSYHKNTGVVNDPLGQASVCSAVKICFVLLDFDKWKRTDSCESILPALWLMY